MRNWLGIAGALGVAAALPVACSSSIPVPYPTVTDFCTAKAQDECQIAGRCAIPAASCEQVRDQLCLTAAAQAMSGARNYYQPNAQACLNAVNSAYSQASTSGQISYAVLYGSGSVDDLCNRVFQGATKNGAPCTTDYDCVNNGVCSLVPGATQAVCATPEVVDADQFCANPGSECSAGSYCTTVSGSEPLCTARLTAGSECKGPQLCLETLRCVDATCTARQEIGQACTTDDDCSAGGPYCDSYYGGGECTLGPSFAAKAPDCNGYQPGAADAGSAPPMDAASPPEEGGTPDASGGG